MKPSNEEIIQIYLDKKDKATKKVYEVQLFYSGLPEPSDLQSEILIQGCKIMICNLNNRIKYCKNQIKKYA